MKLGLLFAGQGSQTPGMGKDFYEKSRLFKEIFDNLTEEQKNIAFQGPMEALSDTRNTQPIMVAFAAGVMAELKEALSDIGVNPAMTAGLSLGEYSALHAAGVLDAKKAIELVTLRADAMAEAAKGIECKMCAVLNLERDVLQLCCRKAGEKGVVSIANYNCPGQIVIAGEAKAVDEAVALATEKGAKRCIPLPVSGPFHTEFMKPAGEKLADVFKETQFGEMNFPVVFNAIGREKRSEEKVAELLVRQVSGSVYFEDTIRKMAESGVDTIIEIGPGKALSGFVKKTCKDIKVFNIETFEEVEKVKERLVAEMEG